MWRNDRAARARCDFEKHAREKNNFHHAQLAASGTMIEKMLDEK